MEPYKRNIKYIACTCLENNAFHVQGSISENTLKCESVVKLEGTTSSQHHTSTATCMCQWNGRKVIYFICNTFLFLSSAVSSPILSLVYLE